MNTQIKQKDMSLILKEIYNDKGGIQDFLINIPIRLKEIAVPVMFKKNNFVIVKGEKAEYAYFILKGSVSVQSDFLDGNVYQFSNLGEGSVISDLEVLSGKFINAATAIALEDTVALRGPISDFADELRKTPEFLYYVSTSMARKMFRSSYERGRNLYRVGMYKVAVYLTKYVEITGFQQGRSKILKRREEIAKEIGISIRTVNRAICALKEDKVVSIEKGKIIINEKQYAELLDLAEYGID